MSEPRAANEPIGLGVIGLGVMGATHVRCINAIAQQASAHRGPACRLVAVCDRDATRRSGRVASAGNMASISTHEQLFDLAEVSGYSEPAELLADSRVQAVHICTHTDTHVDLAIRAIEAGKHVLVEKPVAVSSVNVQRVIDAAERAKNTGNNLVVMPAMCMRFWPGWPWVREKMRSREFGRVTGATFRRVGTTPTWSGDFYRDAERTGGALVDLHIHDADFVLWCFGEPTEVISVGSANQLTTVYRYPPGGSKHLTGTSGPETQGIQVVAEGGWGMSPGFGFRMQYTVAFEHATAEFELSRTPTVMLYRDGSAQPVELPTESAYHFEIEHFIRRLGAAQGKGAQNANAHSRIEDPHIGHPSVSTPIPPRQSGTTDDGPTLRDALAVARLLEAERQSLETGRSARTVGL